MNEKNVKIVIGSGHGDEGKGLLSRYFSLTEKNPITIFHNGSAQRGHTVDYNPKFRHVYHHFGAGTADGIPTYFADTFWIHPMEFVREYNELIQNGITPPVCYYNPKARVVTPFDMLVDHATEAWIALQNGEREYGSCGLGTWCAIETRGYHTCYPIDAYLSDDNEWLKYMLNDTWNSCVAALISRGVDIEQLPKYKEYFIPNSIRKENTINHFIDDINFFFSKTKPANFDNIYNSFDSLVFENAQGLGLDMNSGEQWHTTSNTGLINPYNILKDKEDFKAEVCYVTRSYATRHGLGVMDNETPKKEINENMFDKTNIHNEFQGSLRYGFLEASALNNRINKDFELAAADKRFMKSLAVTHCNEFPNFNQDALYLSNNPYSVFKR